MSGVANTNLHGLAASAAEVSPQTHHSLTAPTDSADDQKLKKAAGDFEAILLSSLWKSMKQSFASPEEDASSDPAKSTLDDWGIEIMSGAVGRSGGLGLGAMIVRQLEPDLRPEAGSTSGEAGTLQKRSSGETAGAIIPAL